MAKSKKMITINGRVISESSSPFILAEAGVNYYDIANKEDIEPLDAAKLMIAEAVHSGADGIKFQTYKADKLTVKNSPAYWDTTKETAKSQYDLFKKFDKFNKDDYIELAKYSKAKKIIFMSTPFDTEAVEWLDELVPAFKIASADITNLPFISSIAKKRKPIFLSTGASTIEEIKDAVDVIKKEKNNQIVILHCILNYPTRYKDANLGMIVHLKNLFPNYLIGYSDHTLPDADMLVVTAAFLLGARVIEKHFTLDKTIVGNDHFHSMDSRDLKKFVDNIHLIEKTIGSTKKAPLDSESSSIKYARRSLVANIDIPKNNIIQPEMLIAKRPGTGISPKFWHDIIGKTAKRNIKKDEIISWEDIF